MPRKRRPSLVLATAAVLAIALASTLAACGSGDDNSSSSSSSTSSTTATTGGGETMSVQSISGAGDVLVDADGDVLYTNDMDTGNKPACTGECAAVWVPLTVPTGSTVKVNSSDVPGSVGVITLADGSSQVTYNDKPLYTFTEDSPGQATGDGVTDSFAGVSFTWSVATPSGSAASAAATDTTDTTATTSGSSSSGSSGSSSGSSGSSGSSSGGSSGGGYGY